MEWTYLQLILIQTIILIKVIIIYKAEIHYWMMIKKVWNIRKIMKVWNDYLSWLMFQIIKLHCLWRIKTRESRICLEWIQKWFPLQKVKNMLDWLLKYQLYSQLRMVKKYWIKVIWLILELLRGDRLLKINIKKLWI